MSSYNNHKVHMDSSFQNDCISKMLVIRLILYDFLDINLIILFYLFPNYKLYLTNKLQATKTLISMTEKCCAASKYKVYIKIHVHSINITFCIFVFPSYLYLLPKWDMFLVVTNFYCTEQ